MPKDQAGTMPELPVSFTQSGDHQSAAHWWQEFDDAQLNQLVEEALTSNFSLKSSMARLEQAAAQANISDSGLYPILNGSAGHGYRRNQQQNGLINERDTSDVDFRARWEIDLWGRLQHRSDAAAYDYLASSEALQSAAISLAGNIARTWYQLSEQNARIEVLAAQLQNIEHIMEVSRLRYISGQGSISAVWRQEQLEESIRANHLQANKRREIHTRQLNVLLGRSPSADPTWEYADFPELPPIPATGIPANLIETRPDVRNRWYQYQARRHSAAEAKAARIPSFSITAGADTSNDVNTLFDFWATDFAVSMNVPIFRGGQLKGQQRRAEAIATRALYDYTDTVLVALREVEINLLEEQSQQELLTSLQQQTHSASNILNVESTRYSQGIQGYLDVLNAQERLFNLQLRGITAERQLLERRIALYQSIGSGLMEVNDNGDLMVSTAHMETEQP